MKHSWTELYINSSREEENPQHAHGWVLFHKLPSYFLQQVEHVAIFKDFSHISTQWQVHNVISLSFLSSTQTQSFYDST